MALRDSTIAVNWDVSGVNQLRDTDKEIEESVASAEDLENQAGQAGQELEEAGDKGKRSFQSLSTTVEQFSEELDTVATGGAIAAGAGLAGTAAISEAAGDMQEARTAIRAQADGSANALIREAEAFESFANSAITAEEVMRGQRQLLRTDALRGETIAELTSAVGNLAVAFDEDVFDVFEELRDPLLRGEGAEQLADKGFIRDPRQILKEAGALEKGINNFRKYKEEMGAAASRRLLVSELVTRGRRKQNAASQQLSTLNARWSGFVNELDKAAAVMGGELAEEQQGLLSQWTRWLRLTRDQNPELLETIGNTVAFAASVGALTFGISKLVGWAATLSATVAGLSLTGALGITAAIVGVAALITEIGALILTGETLVAGEFFRAIGRNIAFAATRLGSFINETLGLESKFNAIAGWINDWMVEPTKEAVMWMREWLQMLNLTPEQGEVPAEGNNQMLQTPGAGSVPFDVGLPSVGPQPSPSGSRSNRDRRIIHEHRIKSDDTDPDTKKTSEAIAEEVGRLLQKQQSVEVEGAK